MILFSIQALLEMENVACKHQDPHLAHHISLHYLPDQVNVIKKLADLHTRLKRSGDSGLGLHIIDRELNNDWNSIKQPIFSFYEKYYK